MKRLSWKYLAGLIDGEGCLDLQVTKIKGYQDRYYIRPRIRISLFSPSAFLLEIIKNFHGGSLIVRSSNNPVWSDSYSWELVGYRNVCKFLRNIAKHLILKKEQARLLLWIEKELKGKQVSLAVKDAMKEELGLMKRDPHRLSERAQERISLVMRQSR